MVADYKNSSSLIIKKLHGWLSEKKYLKKGLFCR